MKLYKYRYGSKRDLESLQNDYFYAPHPSKLNDPSENLFDDNHLYAALDLFEKYFEKSTGGIKEQINDLCKRIRKNIGIFSLSKTEKDELLWAYYADSHSGFCIEYDFEKLVELNPIAASFEINYQDNVPRLKFDKIINGGDQVVTDILKMTSGVKSKNWKHEKEFRICIENFGRFEYDYRAVKAIYFGLRMPKTQNELDEGNKELPDYFSKVCQQQVMEALKGRGVKYYQMVLKQNSYYFEYVEVEDLYKDAKKYKDKIGYISPEMIDYSDYGRGVEPQYFDKVAEIIRREPYFYKLNSIYVSKEESIKREEPVIFVGFFKEENNWRQIKKYYTLSQVDEAYDNLNL